MITSKLNFNLEKRAKKKTQQNKIPTKHQDPWTKQISKELAIRGLLEADHLGSYFNFAL